MDENLKNLNIILSAMKKDHLGKKDFTQSFKFVVDFVKKIEARNIKEFEYITKTITSLSKKLEKDGSTTNDKLQRTITSELESMLRRFSAKSKELDNKMGAIKDGKDADEEKIVQEVLSQIKLPEYKETVLDNSEQLRDKLELLKGDDRISVEAISGLEDYVKENMPGKTPFGGSVVHKFSPPTVPTGTINGTNKTFTLPKAPVNDSLQLFRGGALQEEGSGNDFTLANKTITFDVAPVVGEKLLAYYRYF